MRNLSFSKMLLATAIMGSTIVSANAKTVVNNIKVPVESSVTANPINSDVDLACQNTSDQTQLFNTEWPLFTLDIKVHPFNMGYDGGASANTDYQVAIPLDFKTSKMVALSNGYLRSCRGLALTGYIYRDPLDPSHWSSRYTFYMRTTQGTQQIKTGKLDLAHMSLDANKDIVHQSFNLATQEIDPVNGQRRVYQLDLTMHPSQQYYSWLIWKQGQNRKYNKNGGPGTSQLPLEDPNATLSDVMVGGHGAQYASPGFHDPVRPNVGGFGSMAK